MTTSPELLAAGFTSVERAREALSNLYRRRQSLLDRQLDVTMHGGGDLGYRAMGEAERSSLNRKILEGGDLREIDQKIGRLERILSGLGDDSEAADSLQ